MSSFVRHHRLEAVKESSGGSAPGRSEAKRINSNNVFPVSDPFNESIRRKANNEI